MEQDIAGLTPGAIGDGAVSPSVEPLMAATTPIENVVVTGNAAPKTDETIDISRGILRILLLVGTVGWMFSVELGIYNNQPASTINSGYLQLGIGLLLVIINIGNILDRQVDSIWTMRVAVPGIERIQIKIGWLALSLVLTGYICYLETLQPTQTYFSQYLIMWGLAIVAGALAILPDRKHRTTIADDRPLVRWEYVLLIGLFVVGFAIRGIGLDKVPYMLDQDEAAFARQGAAIALLYHFQVSPFEPGWYSWPNMHSELIGVAVTLFGRTLVAARIFSALLGALTIPALYLLGRELFNRSVGVVAALFMLGWAYQIHFSRLALNQPGDLFLSTLACYFLLQGLRRRTSFSYFLAGVCLGVAQLFYLGSRLMLILFVLYLLFLLIRQPRLILSQWKQIGIMIVTLVIITAPQNFFLLYNHAPISAQFGAESILAGPLQNAIAAGNGVQFVLIQLVEAFGALFAQPDLAWYGPASNLLGWVGAPLLLIGVLTTFIVFWVRPRWILPLAWLLGIVLGGGALQTTASAYERFYPGSSAMALLVGVGVWVLCLSVAELLAAPRIANRLMPILGVVIFAAGLAFFLFAYIPARSYFRNYQNWLTNRLSTEMVSAVNRGRYPVIVAGYDTGLLNTVVVQFYMTDVPYTYMDDQTTIEQAFAYQDTTAYQLPSVDQAINFNQPITFFVSPKRLADLRTLTRMYPNGRLKTINLAEDGSFAFYEYEVDQPQF